MQNLKIVATLANPIAVYDNWTPSLDNLLEWIILDRHNLVMPNPSLKQIENNKHIVIDNMPLKLGNLFSEWYWCVSSPCYQLLGENTDRYRKRWDNHDKNLDWGKRKPKFSTDHSGEKSYDLPLFVRSIKTITWYCIGDKDKLKTYLEQISHLGKKRSYGNGQISNWDIQEIGQDCHLTKNNQLIKPIPAKFAEYLGLTGYSLMNWGWRPPVRIANNQTLCAMPTQNVYFVTK